MKHLNYGVNMLTFVKKTMATAKNTTYKVSAAAVAYIAYSNQAFAQTQQTGQQGPVNAQNFQQVAGNVTSSLNTFSTLATTFAAVAGLVLVANSLFNLYKASKDPSHQVKPMSGIIGLVIGGLLVAVGTVVSISKTSVVGS